MYIYIYYIYIYIPARVAARAAVKIGCFRQKPDTASWRASLATVRRREGDSCVRTPWLACVGRWELDASGL